MGSPAEDLGQVLGIGDHCSVDHCRQVDFLPFKCDCCNRTYCLEHRSYQAHACPNSGQKDTTVIVCPICAKSIRLEPGQDPNALFDGHTRTDCDPANYARVHKKPRCPVTGCKEKLTTIKAYRCKHCSQRVCLKHRDPRDHRCDEVQAVNRSSRATLLSGTAAALGIGRNNAGPAATAAPPSTTASSARTGAPARAARNPHDDPANSLRGTAARRMQLASQPQPQPPASSASAAGSWWPWQQQTNQPPPPQQQLAPQPSAAATGSGRGAAAAATTRATAAAPTTATTTTTTTTRAASNANPLVPPHLPERCPQCGAAFATVERLIQHVEDFHPAAATAATASIRVVGGAGGGGGGGGNGAGGAGAGGTFANPLRGLLEGTIAGGPAPYGAPAPYGHGRGVGAAGAAAGREEFRCHTCSRAFTDPVELVQHAERCASTAAAAAAAGLRGVAVGGPGGSGRGGGGGGRAGDGSRDNCSIS